MSRIYLIPYSYRAVRIDGTNEIDTQSFYLAFPSALSRAVPVAGGELFDYNYGLGAKLLPKPFEINFVVEAATAVLAGTAFDNFFGLPPTGFYGEVGEFKAQQHAGASLFVMDCEFIDVEVYQDANWYNGNKRIISNIRAVFKPLNLYTADV